MQLTFAKWILPLSLVSLIAFGQQPTAASTQKPVQASGVTPSTAQSTRTNAARTTKTHQRVVRSKYSKTSGRKGAKRREYRPEYTQNSVEVMNGASTQKVVFESNKDATAKGLKNVPVPLKVEVVNGTSTDTQYFYGDNGRQESDEKRPVVVGVQSSDTRAVGGNKHPVVTGITAVEAGDAKSASGGGQKVATVISPKPKRPEYQPDAH